VVLFESIFEISLLLSNQLIKSESFVDRSEHFKSFDLSLGQAARVKIIFIVLDVGDQYHDIVEVSAWEDDLDWVIDDNLPSNFSVFHIVHNGEGISVADSAVWGHCGLDVICCHLGNLAVAIDVLSDQLLDETVGGAIFVEGKNFNGLIEADWSTITIECLNNLMSIGVLLSAIFAESGLNDVLSQVSGAGAVVVSLNKFSLSEACGLTIGIVGNLSLMIGDFDNGI